MGYDQADIYRMFGDAIMEEAAQDKPTPACWPIVAARL